MSGSAVPVDAGLAQLRAELRAAQRRSVFLGIANAALLAVAVALGLFCLLRVMVLLWPDVAAFRLEALSGLLSGGAENTLGHFIVTGLIGVAVFVLAAALVFAERPKIETMARRGDRIFALSERLSTAVEVAGRPVRDTVSNALLRDVADRAGAVGRGALVPLRVPLVAGAVLVLALAAALLPTPGVRSAAGPAVSGPAAAPALAAAERIAVAEDVRRVAAVVAADAERRTDPYLAAIARELETVAEAVATDRTFDRQAVADALRRLVPYANDAFGAGGAAGADATNFAPLIEAAANTVDPTGAAPRAPLPGTGEPQQMAGAATGANGQPATENPAGLGALERLDEANAAMTMTPPLAGGEFAGIADEGSYAAPWALPGEAVLEGVLGARPGGRLDAGVPGAAPIAGMGEGDAVGAGTVPLGNGALTEFGALPLPTTEMLLADMTEGNGRRIRLDAAPQAVAGQALPPADLPAGTGWRTVPESPVSRTFLPIGLGQLLSRYFAAADPNQ